MSGVAPAKNLPIVARIVHFIKQHLVGKTLAKVTAQVDENVYGKVGVSAEDFMNSLTGKKVVDARQQGKYFWYVVPVRTSMLQGCFRLQNAVACFSLKRLCLFDLLKCL